MLALILIGWILYQLSAPAWCWVLLGVSGVVKLVSFGCKVGAEWEKS